MKSERRHELEQNALAKWLAENAQQIKPYINAIVGGALVVLLLVLAWSWWSRYSRQSQGEAWNAYYAAAMKGADELEDVAEQFPGTETARWARLQAADMRLAEGCATRFQNRDLASQELGDAVEDYLAVLDDTRDSLLRERATWGLAQAYECRGELDKATEQYQQIVTSWPDGLFRPQAEERVAFLKDPAGQQFYKKFAQFKPSPALADEPGTPGARPDFKLDSLDAPPPAAEKP